MNKGIAYIGPGVERKGMSLCRGRYEGLLPVGHPCRDFSLGQYWEWGPLNTGGIGGVGVGAIGCRVSLWVGWGMDCPLGIPPYRPL
jgi:hypothetical protein